MSRERTDAALPAIGNDLGRRFVYYGMRMKVLKWIQNGGFIVVSLSLSCVISSAKEPMPTVKQPAEQTIKVTAKKFEYSPEKIILHKGVPVLLELISLDRKHGFSVPELGIRAEIKPNEITRVRVVPDKTGTFEFHCDVFCGDGHEGMSGEIVVQP
jgi:cytochrome c oxidase subunit 2